MNTPARWTVGSAIWMGLVSLAAAQAPPATQPAMQMPGTTSPPMTAMPEATAQPTEPGGATSATYPYEGVVTGDSVYVRSGAGTNWYPTAKLNAGAHVRVIAEQSGWLKIVPPAGSFSYVEAASVERSAGSNRGVTKVDGVYVKAGSDSSRRKSAVQRILPKGTEVAILGEEEGFLKISPPEGSYLYISEQYVKSTSEAEAFLAARRSRAPESGAQPADRAGESAAARAGEQPQVAQGNESGGAGGASPAGPPLRATASEALRAPSKYRVMLDAAEAELRTLLATKGGPTGDAFGRLAARYREIAEQDEDRVAQAVAKARVDQITAQGDLEKIVAEAQQRQTSLDSFRAKLGDERTRISNAQLPPELRAWDLKGELRRSMAFGGRRDRYRLVDPLTQGTVAYIDIPSVTGLDPITYLNRYVGIRVASQYFSTAAKVPIAVAAEIQALPGPATRAPMKAEVPAADNMPPAGPVEAMSSPATTENSDGKEPEAAPAEQKPQEKKPAEQKPASAPVGGS